MTDELARLARDAAPGVLAEALERARTQAVDRLAGLLADTIVAQALAGTVPAALSEERPPERRDGGRRDDEPAEALYAYGISAADLPLAPGLRALTDDGPLQRVVLADVALLVSRVRPEQLRIDEDDLSETGRLATLARGHDAVLRAAAAGGPVLPLRFGTVVPDEGAAHRLLREHGQAAREQLLRIGDSREWGVKLVRSLVAEAVTAGSRASDRRAVTGTEYLTRRRQALEQREAAEADAAGAAAVLEETLHPHVTESLRRGGSPGSSLLLDLAVLVRPIAEAAFLAETGALADRFAGSGFAVEVSGPWPPYSFVSLGGGDA